MKFEELKKLSIIFIPRETPYGQTSDCMGLATLLNEKGHRVIVVVSHKDQVLTKEPDAPERSDGEVESECSGTNQPSTDEQAKPKEDLEIVEFGQEQMTRMKVQHYDQLSSLFKLNPSVVRNWISFLNETFLDFKKALFSITDRNSQLEHLAQKYNPDIFVTDGLFQYDTINKTGKPWVWLFGGNPLRIMHDDHWPPPYTGLPTEVNATKLAQIHLLVARILATNLYKLIELFKKVINFGLKTNRKPFQLITDGSPYLNIYGYPKELDYSKSTEWGLNFYRVDTFSPKRKLTKEALNIPSGIMPENNERKKVILVTMGHFHSGNVKFMKTLLNNLSVSSHNFLISKEFSAKEYQLSPNMTSFDPSLTQNQLIEASDLVITDGNDGTILSAFSLGKPMIVIPFWLGQLDNAQRLHEMGYGIRLSPWTYTQNEILGAIEMLLNDKKLKEKLSAASTRIIEENRLWKAVELIENLGVDRHFYQDE